LNASANIGIAYNFPKRGWEAPVIPVVVPVVPKYTDAEGDALVAQLNDANNRIKGLEEDLAKANNRIAELEEDLENVNRGPMATVYFQINKSNIDRNNKKVIAKIADAIKATPNVKYVVTGYADENTGNPTFNAKLRNERAQAVYNTLIKNGVNPDQLEWNTSKEVLNKFDFTKDRAATINVVAQ
jgi:outer membrane protein OmpA-like peptidoglycan-associated protein